MRIEIVNLVADKLLASEWAESRHYGESMGAPALGID